MTVVVSPDASNPRRMWIFEPVEPLPRKTTSLGGRNDSTSKVMVSTRAATLIFSTIVAPTSIVLGGSSSQPACRACQCSKVVTSETVSQTFCWGAAMFRLTDVGLIRIPFGCGRRGNQAISLTRCQY